MPTSSASNVLSRETQQNFPGAARLLPRDFGPTRGSCASWSLLGYSARRQATSHHCTQRLLCANRHRQPCHGSSAERSRLRKSPYKPRPRHRPARLRENTIGVADHGQQHHCRETPSNRQARYSRRAKLVLVPYPRLPTIIASRAKRRRQNSELPLSRLALLSLLYIISQPTNYSASP